MTLILHRSDVGEDLRAPQTLAPRRRRLSTIAARRARGRPCIVSVHRTGALLQPDDETVRLRGDWSRTLVGPQDTVVITYLPLGGALGGKGGGGGGKAIGAAVAMIAIAVAAPYLVGAMGGVFGSVGALSLTGKIVSAGLIAGAAYFVSKATQAKANKEEEARPVYGVSGGGNMPRPGDRIPVHYGRVWSQPDLSQGDYFVYKGDDQVLFKRMTVGAGKYDIHKVKVGQALMWTDDGGLQAPFEDAEIEFITPGQDSDLVPGGVYSSENVAGIELPYDNEPVEWVGPFPVTEPTIETRRIQLDFSWPQGRFSTHPRKSGNLPIDWGVRFQYAEIDVDGNVTGAWKALHVETGFSSSTSAVRKTKFISVPKGRYAVRAQNAVPKILPELEAAGVTHQNMVMWDGLRAHLHNEPARPDVTEIAIKVSAEAMGSTMSFSDISVETTSILSTWRGGPVWIEQPTRKAVDIAVDILRNTVYGGAYPEGKIDLATFYYYFNLLSEHDTFDGTIRGPVPVFEAAATVLGVMRAEPVLVGDVWSMVRDEPREYGGHVITRRQIVKDTSGAEFDLDMSDGASDVLVEYFVAGDQNRRAEYRATIGAQTITPRRINLFGVSSHAHAVMLARWYAASAYYRRESRSFTMERAGRIVERNDPARIDTWFLDETIAVGIESRSIFEMTLDVDVALPAGAHIVLRDPYGQEWGPVAVTAGVPDRTVVLDSADVAVVEAATGTTLASLFTKTNRRLPVTGLIGTVSTLAKPYIIRTARPEGVNKVQVTAVYDAPEVWTVIGEAVPPAPPVKAVIENEGDLAPVLPWVSGYVTQKATAAVLEWSVGQARGCKLYRVDIAYEEEGGTWGEWSQISAGPAMSGSFVVEYRASTSLRIRGIAINVKGVLSSPVYTVATLIKPLINNEIARIIVAIADMQEQLRKDIESIHKLGEGTLRDGLKTLNDELEKIAAAGATSMGSSYEQRELIKVGLNENYAAIMEEATARADADGAAAELLNVLTARANDPETGFGASASGVESLKVAVGLNGTGAEAKASKITALEASVNGNGGSQTGLLSQVATITSNVNGVRAQWGVSWAVNGSALGGIMLTGMTRLDGSQTTVFGVHGDMIVTGTITASSLYTLSAVITGQLQVGSLTIGNTAIREGAVSSVVGSSGTGFTASASVTVRPGAKVAIIAMYNGNLGFVLPLGTTGTLRIRRGGTNIASITNNYYVGRSSTTSWTEFQQTSLTHVDEPSPGTYTYTVEDTQPGGVSIIVMELAK